jgi:hypothetical protein
MLEYQREYRQRPGVKERLQQRDAQYWMVSERRFLQLVKTRLKEREERNDNEKKLRT